MFFPLVPLCNLNSTGKITMYFLWQIQKFQKNHSQRKEKKIKNTSTYFTLLGLGGCSCCRGWSGPTVSRCVFFYCGRIDRILPLEIGLNVVIDPRGGRGRRVATATSPATPIWVLGTRRPAPRFRRGGGYGSLNPIVRSRSRVGWPMRGRRWRNPAGGRARPRRRPAAGMSTSGSVGSGSWHIPQWQWGTRATSVAFDLKNWS